MRSGPPFRLVSYMITGDAPEATVVASVTEALHAGVDLVQVRRKGASGGQVESLVCRIIESVEGARGRLMVNDRLDVALALRVLGVHLPAAGLPVAEVRRAVPRGFQIGASVHTQDEAERAARGGADFVLFGPVYPTRSKPGHPGCGLDVLRRVVQRLEVPVFALGGISPERVPELVDTGVRGVAGISGFASARSRDALLAAIRSVNRP